MYMNKFIYKVIHSFYTYTVACAVGLLVNGIFIVLIYAFLHSPADETIVKVFVGKDGIRLFIASLVLGLFIYRYTRKLNIVRKQ